MILYSDPVGGSELVSVYQHPSIYRRIWARTYRNRSRYPKTREGNNNRYNKTYNYLH